MKHQQAKPKTLVQTILKIGIRAVLISLLVELLLLIFAVVIGTIMWMKHDIISGMVSGLLAFIIGQSFVYLLLDFIFFLPDEPMEKERSVHQRSSKDKRSI